MFEYLKDESKNLSRNLYQEVFKEDSESFVSYYYEEKTKDNQILCIKEDEEIISMLHLNPYKFRFYDKEFDIDYIVAVATKENQRRKGYMRKILSKSLLDMYEKKRLFTFLLPANIAYYEDFDFVLKDEKKKNEFNEKGETLSIREYEEKDKEAIISLINFIMISKYNLFIPKNEILFDRYLKELKSENGYIKVYEDKEKQIKAFKSFWGIEKEELRDFISFDEYIKDKEENEKSYMFRIVNLLEFVKNIRLKEDSKRSIETLKLRIKDDIIKENTASYLWTISRYESYLEVLDAENNSDIREFSIKEFTDFIFNESARINEEVFEDIEIVNKIFINEVV